LLKKAKHDGALPSPKKFEMEEILSLELNAGSTPLFSPLINACCKNKNTFPIWEGKY